MASTLTVQVQKLALDWSVGILDTERTQSQTLWISVDADVQVPDMDGSETYQDVLCYADIVAYIQDYAKQGHVDLVETIAHTICTYVLSQKGVYCASVSVHKPDIIDACESVGVVLTKSK